ncbi:MAG TPA: hypothetical protein ENJ82_17425, partial [Bacteroidetes bacterium]|nr:hypothetical protein [Bacteroidota bacterium]
MQLIQKFFLSLFLLLFTLPALGQNQCANAIFSDDFSNPSLWTYLGSHTNGVLDISGGTLNFKSYENRQNYRLVRNLALPLFNQWRIEWEFMETGNEERIGAMLMAVTSGSDHPRWATAGSPPETNQDMIGVFVDNPLTGGANPHRFFVSSKQGTNHQYGPSTIDYSVGVQYYMRLQRIAQDKAILSVYSDPARTNHIPGSPLCFDIDKNIGEFFFLQTGVSTLACACRYITATQDNLCIFGNNTPEGCLSEGCQINAAITRYVNSVDCSVTFT